MHCAALAYSLITGDPKLSEICYCWYQWGHGIFTASIFCSLSYVSVC